jgi:transposase
VTEERLRFVARLLEGEGMSEVCRAFGISRKTGYKIFNRYQDEGLDALADRSRRPVRYANQLPDPVERLIVDLKRDKPHWGARKIRELLIRKLAGDMRLPAKSTVHAVLDRHGLVKRARVRKNRAAGTPLSAAALPNDLWCADFKGEFKLGNGRYCYPLTVTDQASRYLLLCEAFDSTREAPACIARRSMSPPCSPVRSSESRKSMTAFGSSASCTMISAISTWSREPCRPSTIRSARDRHLCLRYKPSPMSPGRTVGDLALPREVKRLNEINRLIDGLGNLDYIDAQ